MTDSNQTESVAGYGRARRASWLGDIQARADDLAAGALDGHVADHDVVTAGQRGMFGDIAPETVAAAVARRRVGGDFIGQARDIPQLGGTNWESMGAGAVAPIPGGAYARPVDDERPAPGTVSPLLAHMRGREQ